MKIKLAALSDQGLTRSLKKLHSNGAMIVYQGKEYINFSSNDYLGISAKTDWQNTFLKTLNHSDIFLMGASSSRLLTGNNEYAEALESYLASLFGTNKQCLLYNSGYHANVGILPAITDKDDLILADKLVHASIIDALKLCSCRWQRFPHNDYDSLEKQLQNAQNKYKQIYIVTESVFSMDGDCADLNKLVALKKQYQAQLYVDEAHSFGVYGTKGLGMAEEAGLIQDIDYLMCTLGKSAGSEGAFLICNQEAKTWLINRSRTLIYTTATPAINLLWTHFIIKKIVNMQNERTYLKAISRQFHEQLNTFNLLGDTHIIPLIIGENTRCNTMATYLQQQGIWAMPIRPPTVPAGQARIRFSLTVNHTQKHLDNVYETLLAYQE